MNDIIKTVKSLEHPGLLIKRVTLTFENKTREQRNGFLGMLLGTLRATPMGNL